MKKFTKLLTTAICMLALFAAGCGSDSSDNKQPAADAPVKIGVTAGPHAEIMDNVKKLAAKQNLQIEVVEFADYVTPNVALYQEEIFANCMQHAPYLEATKVKEPKFDLVEVFKAVNFPMAVYSKTLKAGDAIPDGAIIGIPNDPSNGGRALLLLADKGLIKVKNPSDVTTSVKDITENPHNYTIRELDAAIIPNSLPDLTCAVINANYAIPAGLNPTSDSILLERSDNPYVNIFVTKEKYKNDPRIAQIQKIYQSEENKKFIDEHFKGSILAAW